MKSKKIDRILEAVHRYWELQEEVGGGGMSTGPTMSTGGPTNRANKAGLGFDPQTESPPVFKGRRKKTIYLGIGSRKRWS